MAIKPDVVIAGAGPAGSTAGYLLTGLGFRVLLLEKSEFPRYRIGESLTPSILSILDFLKLRQTVEREEFLRMPGHTVCRAARSRGSPTCARPRRVAHLSRLMGLVFFELQSVVAHHPAERHPPPPAFQLSGQSQS